MYLEDVVMRKNYLEIYLSSETDTKFLIIARSLEGQAETKSDLPFSQDILERTTLIKLLESDYLNIKQFGGEEISKLEALGILLPDKITFISHRDTLSIIGRAMYESLFPEGEVRDLLNRSLTSSEKENAPLHIQIDFNASITERSRLPDYPWEVSYNGQYFLAQRQVIFSRHISQLSNVPSVPRNKKLNVLLVSSTASDRENGFSELSGEEKRSILNGVKVSQENSFINLQELESTTLKSLREYLIKVSPNSLPHIVHFDAHGGFGKRCNNIECKKFHKSLKLLKCDRCGYSLSEPQGYILLGDNESNKEFVSARELGDLLYKFSFGSDIIRKERQDSIILVVLSACKSAMALGSPSIFNGVAQSLIQCKIPAVIAMQYTVRVHSASLFSETFYQSLSNQNSLAISISYAIEALGFEGNQWYRPILYLRWQDNKGGDLFFDDSTYEINIRSLQRIEDGNSLHINSSPIFRIPSQEALVGRADVVNRILRELENQARLITIYSGIGGIGKTSLANHITHLVQKKLIFVDGIIFVELEEISNIESLILRTIATLGMKDIVSEEQLVEFLRSKKILIVYDNIEDLVLNDPEKFSNFLERLLKWTSVSILCTGRQLINMAEELVVEVLPLTTDSTETLMLNLFQRKFSENDIDLKLVKFLADFCDGIPLVANLIVSWFPKYSLEEYIYEFNCEKSLALQNSRVGRGSKTNNYYISMQLTYEKLDKNVQKFLRYICILPTHPVVSMLPKLEDISTQSLTRELRNWNILSHDVQDLKVLIPIREVVRRFSSDEDMKAVAKSIIDFLSDAVQEQDHNTLDDLFSTQSANFTYALLRVSSMIGDLDAKRVTNAILNIQEQYTKKGLLKDSEKIIKQAIEFLECQENSISYKIYAYLGNICRIQSLDSITPYQEALNCSDVDEIGKAKILLGLANSQKTILKFSEARKSYEDALAIFSRLGSFPRESAACSWGLANISFALSQWEDALKLYQKSFSIYDSIEPSQLSIKGKIDCLKGLCDIHIKKKEYIKARDSILQAHEIYYTSTPPFIDRVTEAKIQQGLGDISKIMFASLSNSELGEVPLAQDTCNSSNYFTLAQLSYNKAIELYHSMSAPVGEALSIYKLAELNALSNHLDQADVFFKQARKIFEASKYTLGILKSEISIYKIRFLKNIFSQEDIDNLFTLLEVCREKCKSKYWEGEIINLLIILNIRLGNRQAARELQVDSRKIFKSLKRSDKIIKMKPIADFELSIKQLFNE